MRRDEDGVRSSRRGRAELRLQLRAEAAAACRELSTQVVVLKQHRRQQGRRDAQELGVQILDLPLQLHPPVLEPRFHLGDTYMHP